MDKYENLLKSTIVQSKIELSKMNPMDRIKDFYNVS